MFENISKRLENIKRKFFSSGVITENNIEEGIREIRRALLEADVNISVVKTFVNRVKEKALGENLIKHVRPGDQFIKIVSDELTALMGPVDHTIRTVSGRPTVIMSVGLQGSGKTTTCGKLANYLIEKGHRPLLAAADTQRPAAIEQLKTLGETLSVPVFSARKMTPPEICKKAIPEAEKNNCDIVILDTAGRLHIDDELMAELTEIKKRVVPDHIFLVTDAMTGQDAVNSAQNFNEVLDLDGVILTKLDGDARGGAALSIKEVTGKPIKFIGMGEKLDALQEFHPDRMAERILGMGDIVGLVDRAQKVIDEEEAERMQEKLLEGSFTMHDLLDQFGMIKKMGNLRDLLGMLPGGMGAQLQGMDIDDRAFVHIEAIIQSMTPDERTFPDIIDGNRRLRIAKGSGRTTQEVNQLLTQFRQMRSMMRNLGGSLGGLGGLGGGLGGGGLGGLGGGLLGGIPGMGGGRKRAEKKKKDRKKKEKRKKKKK